MIRRLGTLTGKTLYVGYDHHLLPEVEFYLGAMGGHGPVHQAVELPRPHYLRSAQLTCEAVQQDPDAFGVLICSTGLGMSIAANKFAGIYAARCMSVADAELSRTINNANVLCLAGQSGQELNRQIFHAFATTPYVGRKLDELATITQLEQHMVVEAPARTMLRLV